MFFTCGIEKENPTLSRRMKPKIGKDRARPHCAALVKVKYPPCGHPSFLQECQGWGVMSLLHPTLSPLHHQHSKQMPRRCLNL